MKLFRLKFWLAAVWMCSSSVPLCSYAQVTEDTLGEKFKPDRHYYLTLRELSHKAFLVEEYAKAINYSVQAIMYAVTYDPHEFHAYEDLGDIYHKVGREPDAHWCFWQGIKALDKYKIEGREEIVKRLTKKLRMATVVRVPAEFKGMLKDEEEKLPEREFTIDIMIGKDGVIKTLERGEIRLGKFQGFLKVAKMDWGVGPLEKSPLILAITCESEIPYVVFAGVLIRAAEVQIGSVRLILPPPSDQAEPAQQPPPQPAEPAKKESPPLSAIRQATYVLPGDLLRIITRDLAEMEQPGVKFLDDDFEVRIRMYREPRKIHVRGGDAEWQIDIDESKPSGSVKAVVTKVEDVQKELLKKLEEMRRWNRDPERGSVYDTVRPRVAIAPEGEPEKGIPFETGLLIDLLNELRKRYKDPVYFASPPSVGAKKAPAEGGAGQAPAPPAPAGEGKAPAPAGEGKTPPPEGGGQTPAPGGAGQTPAPGDQKKEPPQTPPPPQAPPEK